MFSFSDLKPGKKTFFCFLLLAFFSAVLMFNSVSLRDDKLYATYSVGSLELCEGCKTRYEWHTASTLTFVNNWLQEGIWNLRFGLFHAPRSIEVTDFEQRFFYPAYPPGAMLPIYLLFRVVDSIGFIDDFAVKRSQQLLAVIAYNYLLHLLLTVLLCATVFLFLRSINFDRCNSLILACIPAVIQFHNAHSLYWHHMLYTFDQAVLLPYVAFIFLEVLRRVEVSRAVAITGRSLQVLLLFYGVLTDWLFLFVALTVYVLRIINKEIVWPRSSVATMRFVGHSLLFFLPVVAALVLWVLQVSHFSDQNIFAIFGKEGVEATSSYSLVDALLFRTGLDSGIESYLHYLLRAFFTWLRDGYGISGVVMLFTTFYLCVRGHAISSNRDTAPDRSVASFYTMLFLPCLLYNLFFLHHAWNHVFSALKFSLALSVAFVLLPLLLLWLQGKPTNLVSARVANRVDIYATTAISLFLMVFYVYLQIYDSKPLTHFFSTPDFRFLVMGEYIRENTSYEDVMFSDGLLMPIQPPQAMSLSGKRVYWANNLDHIYAVVHDIEEDFRVKIFHFYDQQESEKHITAFLEQSELSVSRQTRENVGSLLSVDGKEFVHWYEQVVPEEQRLQVSAGAVPRSASP